MPPPLKLQGEPPIRALRFGFFNTPWSHVGQPCPKGWLIHMDQPGYAMLDLQNLSYGSCGKLLVPRIPAKGGILQIYLFGGVFQKTS